MCRIWTRSFPTLLFIKIRHKWWLLDFLKSTKSYDKINRENGWNFDVDMDFYFLLDSTCNRKAGTGKFSISQPSWITDRERDSTHLSFSLCVEWTVHLCPAALPSSTMCWCYEGTVRMLRTLSKWYALVSSLLEFTLLPFLSKRVNL